MLKLLKDIVRFRLPALLETPEVWDSLIINRRKPETYRVFTEVSGVRLCLHRFEACDMREAFLHPHPWPGAFMLLSGSYMMNVGFSADLSSAPENSSAISLLMTKGSMYEILCARTWHSVLPLETTYTVMINRAPWPADVAHKQVRTTKGKDLAKMPPEELQEHLAKFKSLLTESLR